MPHAGRSHQVREGSKIKWKVLLMELRLTWQKLKEEKDGQEVEALYVIKVLSNARGKAEVSSQGQAALQRWEGKMRE